MLGLTWRLTWLHIVTRTMKYFEFLSMCIVSKSSFLIFNLVFLSILSRDTSCWFQSGTGNFQNQAKKKQTNKQNKTKQQQQQHTFWSQFWEMYSKIDERKIKMEHHDYKHILNSIRFIQASYFIPGNLLLHLSFYFYFYFFFF